nr:SpoIIE family protein phosphatase [Bacteroidales bacterium]
TLWCKLPSKLIRYDLPSNTFVEYALTEWDEFSVPSQEKSLFFDHLHNILLIGTERGLCYIDPEVGEVKSLTLCEIGIRDIFYDHEGSLWLATDSGLAHCIISEQNDLPYDCEMYIEGQQIQAICQNINHQLILASLNNVLLFDQLTGEIISDSYISYNYDEDLPYIKSMFLGRDKNLWIGTGKGIYQAGLKEPKFSYYNTKSESLSLSKDLISSICASDSNLYLGSWNGGLEVINLKENKTTFYSGEGNHPSYPEEGVNVVYKDRLDRIWVFREGMYLFDQKHERFIPAYEELNISGLEQIKDSGIFDVHELEDGTIIISHFNGIYIIDIQNKSFMNLTELEIDSSMVHLSQVYSIEYQDNSLWLGTVSGIVKYSLAGEDHALYPITAANGAINRVLAMAIDTKDQLWVGTPSGLFRFDKEEKYFEGFSVQNGFANDFIYSIQEDNSGLLWLGTNKGISSLDPLNGEVRNFGVQHGLSCMEFNLNASYYSSDGEMMFGSISGVNMFNPDSLLVNKSMPTIRLTGLKHLNQGDQFYQSSVPDQYRIRDNETIQLFFSLLDYGDPDYVIYSYRVSTPKELGEWNNIGNDNSIILSDLSHGLYKIELLGSSSDEQWTTTPAILNLQVVAPFHRRRIFLGFMLLPFLTLVYFLFEYRMKTLKKSNRALREKEIAAREVLRQKNLLSSRNKGIEDSLKYAQRIQHAMFTSEVEIRKMFPESFILQKPKDIVSGDFYWAKKIGSKVFIAAADCTGHGVPGAFMSLIGLEFFRQIISGQGVHKPSLILDEINKNFDLIFDNEDDLEMRDGMDLAFCVVDTNTNILEYSGAFSPLYIIRDGEIMEIKADKIMLGPDLGYGRRSFTNNVIELQEHDTVYMFSDGYADQFGGPEGKKFKYRRFRHLLLSIYDKPLEMQQKILDNSIVDWQSSLEQVDDILVLGFKPVFSMRN